MTKVELSYNLARALRDEDMDAVARVHGVYGIHRVILKTPEMDSLTVDDVEASLIRGGIPVLRP
jgi:hypothetical protein